MNRMYLINMSQGGKGRQGCGCKTCQFHPYHGEYIKFWGPEAAVNAYWSVISSLDPTR